MKFEFEHLSVRCHLAGEAWTPAAAPRAGYHRQMKEVYGTREPLTQRELEMMEKKVASATDTSIPLHMFTSRQQRVLAGLWQGSSCITQLQGKTIV